MRYRRQDGGVHNKMCSSLFSASLPPLGAGSNLDRGVEGEYSHCLPKSRLDPRPSVEPFPDTYLFEARFSSYTSTKTVILHILNAEESPAAFHLAR